MALTALVLAGQLPAAGFDRGPSIDVGTDPGGASVHVIERSVSDGSGDTGHAPRDGCSRTYVATSDPLLQVPAGALRRPPPPAPSPFHEAFDVCTAARRTSPRSGRSHRPRPRLRRADRPRAAGPARVPARADRRQPGAGLTGLPSWSLDSGTDGAPITISRTQFGISVDLEVRLAGVTWDFGDGDRVAAGLGRALPRAVRRDPHLRDAGHHGVRAAFRFTARYRVDGGPLTDLGPVPRTVTQTYDVVEVRGVGRFRRRAARRSPRLMTPRASWPGSRPLRNCRLRHSPRMRPGNSTPAASTRSSNRRTLPTSREFARSPRSG